MVNAEGNFCTVPVGGKLALLPIQDSLCLHYLTVVLSYTKGMHGKIHEGLQLTSVYIKTSGPHRAIY